MPKPTHCRVARQVAFVGTPELIRALDAVAIGLGESRAHFVRRLVANHLRELGVLAAQAPASKLQARRQEAVA